MDKNKAVNLNTSFGIGYFKFDPAFLYFRKAIGWIKSILKLNQLHCITSNAITANEAMEC